MNAKTNENDRVKPLNCFRLSLVAIIIGVNMLWIDLLPDSSEWRMNVRTFTTWRYNHLVILFVVVVGVCVFCCLFFITCNIVSRGYTRRRHMWYSRYYW